MNPSKSIMWARGAVLLRFSLSLLSFLYAHMNFVHDFAGFMANSSRWKCWPARSMNDWHISNCPKVNRTYYVFHPQFRIDDRNKMVAISASLLRLYMLVHRKLRRAALDGRSHLAQVLFNFVTHRRANFVRHREKTHDIQFWAKFSPFDLQLRTFWTIPMEWMNLTIVRRQPLNLPEWISNKTLRFELKRCSCSKGSINIHTYNLRIGWCTYYMYLESNCMSSLLVLNGKVSDFLP